MPGDIWFLSCQQCRCGCRCRNGQSNPAFSYRLQEFGFDLLMFGIGDWVLLKVRVLPKVIHMLSFK